MSGPVAVRALALAAIAAIPFAATPRTGLAQSHPTRPPASPSSSALLVYHWPIATIYNHEPQLRFQLNERLRPASLSAWVDGRSVRGTITDTVQWYSFLPPRPLAMGHHTVRVRGLTASGDAFDVRWTFYQAAY